MRKTKDILTIIEDEFCKISFETHYEMYQMQGVSKSEGLKMLRASILGELLQKCQPFIEEYLEKNESAK